MNWSQDELKLIDDLGVKSQDDPYIFYKAAEETNKIFKKVGPEIVRICLATAYLQNKKVLVHVYRDTRSLETQFVISILGYTIVAYVDKNFKFNNSNRIDGYLRAVEKYLNDIYNLPQYLINKLDMVIITK